MSDRPSPSLESPPRDTVKLNAGTLRLLDYESTVPDRESMPPEQWVLYIEFPNGQPRWWRHHDGPPWLIALPVVVFFFIALALVSGGGKWLILVTLVVAVHVVLYLVVKRLQGLPHDPFCIHCGQTLVGRPDHALCPRCNMPYRFDVINAYRINAPGVVSRWRHRALMLEMERESGRPGGMLF